MLNKGSSGSKMAKECVDFPIPHLPENVVWLIVKHIS